MADSDFAGGSAASGIWTERFKVHSYDVDSGRQATLEAVCRWFQEAAWNHAEALGVGYERLGRDNKFWVLSRLAVRVERAALWGETLRIETWPLAGRAVFAWRHFEIFDERGARVAGGASAWLVLDLRARKPQRVDKLLSSIPIFPERRALDAEPPKLPAPASTTAGVSRVATYSDVDVNRHVNGARYIGWLLDSYPFEFHATHRPVLLEANYLGETLGGESVSVVACETAPGDYSHSILKANGDEVFRARLLWSAPGNGSRDVI